MQHPLCIQCKQALSQQMTCANCREQPLPGGRPRPNLKLCWGLVAFSLILGLATGIYGGSHAAISRDVPPWVLTLSVSMPLAFVLLVSYLIFFVLTHPEAE